MVFDPSVYQSAPISHESTSNYVEVCRRNEELYDELGFDFTERHYTTLSDIMEEDMFVNHLTLNDELEVVFPRMRASLRPPVRGWKVCLSPCLWLWEN